MDKAQYWVDQLNKFMKSRSCSNFPNPEGLRVNYFVKNFNDPKYKADLKDFEQKLIDSRVMSIVSFGTSKHASNNNKYFDKIEFRLTFTIFAIDAMKEIVMKHQDLLLLYNNRMIGGICKKYNLGLMGNRFLRHCVRQYKRNGLFERRDPLAHIINTERKYWLMVKYNYKINHAIEKMKYKTALKLYKSKDKQVVKYLYKRDKLPLHILKSKLNLIEKKEKIERVDEVELIKNDLSKLKEYYYEKKRYMFNCKYLSRVSDYLYFRLYFNRVTGHIQNRKEFLKHSSFRRLEKILKHEIKHKKGDLLPLYYMRQKRNIDISEYSFKIRNPYGIEYFNKQDILKIFATFYFSSRETILNSYSIRALKKISKKEILSYYPFLNCNSDDVFGFAPHWITDKDVKAWFIYNKLPKNNLKILEYYLNQEELDKIGKRKNVYLKAKFPKREFKKVSAKYDNSSRLFFNLLLGHFKHICHSYKIQGQFINKIPPEFLTFSYTTKRKILNAINMNFLKIEQVNSQTIPMINKLIHAKDSITGVHARGVIIAGASLPSPDNKPIVKDRPLYTTEDFLTKIGVPTYKKIINSLSESFTYNKINLLLLAKKLKLRKSQWANDVPNCMNSKKLKLSHFNIANLKLSIDFKYYTFNQVINFLNSGAEYLLDTLAMYEKAKSKEVLSDLKTLNYRNYNTLKQLHDHLLRVLNKIRIPNTKLPKVKIKKNARFDLKVARTRRELSYWGGQLEHCVGSSSVYFLRAKNHEVVLIGVFKNKKLLYVIEKKDRRLIQVRGKRNSLPPHEEYNYIKNLIAEGNL